MILLKNWVILSAIVGWISYYIAAKYAEDYLWFNINFIIFLPQIMLWNRLKQRISLSKLYIIEIIYGIALFPINITIVIIMWIIKLIRRKK